MIFNLWSMGERQEAVGGKNSSDVHSKRNAGARKI